MKKKPDMATLKSVRIDERTTIYVNKSIPDDVAKKSYLEKIDLTAKESKRFRDAGNPVEKMKKVREKQIEEYPADLPLPEETMDEFEDLE